MYFLNQHTFIVGKDMSRAGDEVRSHVDKTVCLLRVAIVEKKWGENMSQRCIQLEENETRRKRRDWKDE